MSNKYKKLGKLYAVGVGPGDPELLTFKAIKILKTVSNIFSVTSSSESKSTAFDIISDYISNKCICKQLYFPMTKDQSLLKEAWDKNAHEVYDVLKKGEDAAFITLGDPSVYSTYSYLWEYLSLIDRHIDVEVIPGITSFQAASARLNIPLVKGDESLTILTGVNGNKRLEEIFPVSDNIVIMKIYRHWKEIFKFLTSQNNIEVASVISRCGLDGEKVWRDIRDLNLNETPSYFTLAVVKKASDEN